MNQSPRPSSPAGMLVALVGLVVVVVVLIVVGHAVADLFNSVQIPTTPAAPAAR